MRDLGVSIHPGTQTNIVITKMQVKRFFYVGMELSKVENDLWVITSFLCHTVGSHLCRALICVTLKLEASHGEKKEMRNRGSFQLSTFSSNISMNVCMFSVCSIVRRLFSWVLLMAKWLEQASQWQEMYCHDLEIMSSNPSQVELGVHSTSVQVLFDPKI